MNYLLYLLAAMILYDLHLHVIETILGDYKKAWNKWFYWPPAKIFNAKNRAFYNFFWTIFWGIAFLLTLVMIFW